MSKLADRWNCFWFTPDGPTNLGVGRLFVMLGAFFYYRTSNFESWGFVTRSFWLPIPLFEHLHLHPMGPLTMWGLGTIWKLALLLGAIGFFTRTSCAVAFALGIYLLGLPNSIGKIDHSDAILLWSCLIMAVARSGDAWSLDSLIRTARGRSEPLGLPSSPVTLADASRAHAEYRWPVRMMQVMLVLVFCLSGLTKLRTSGLAWAWSDNFRNTLISQYYFSRPKFSIGIAVARHPLLCRVLSLGALMMEVGAPLALFGGLLSLILIPSLFAMQVGNEVLLGIRFRQFMICYGFWVPWVILATLVARRIAGPAEKRKKAAILFDGSCGLCTRTMAIIRRVDLLQQVEILDVMNHWTAVSARFPQLNQDDCLTTMHVVAPDGEVTTGFFAYRTLCKRLPLGWLILPFLYLPGVPTVGEAIYKRIANSRFNNGCPLPTNGTASVGV